MTQTNNTIIQQTSIILIQSNNNKLKHPTSIKEIERTSINNKEHKAILQDIPTAKKIQKHNNKLENNQNQTKI